MNEQQLKQKLTQMVSEYHDPDGIFKSSVDEFIHMYGLRNEQDKLIEYMLAIEYAPDQEEAPDLAKEFSTTKSVISEMEYHLNLMNEIKLINRYD